jgi:hypothetical protein
MNSLPTDGFSTSQAICVAFLLLQYHIIDPSSLLQISSILFKALSPVNTRVLARFSLYRLSSRQLNS